MGTRLGGLHTRLRSLRLALNIDEVDCRRDANLARLCFSYIAVNDGIRRKLAAFAKLLTQRLRWRGGG